MTARHSIQTNWQRLQERLGSCWLDPNATPEAAARYRERQFESVVQQLPLASVSTLATIAVVIWTFRSTCDARILICWALALACAQTINAVVWRKFQRPGGAGPVTARTIRWLALHVCFNAFMYASMTVYLFRTTDDHGRVLIAGVTSAYIAVGGWLFGKVPHIGLSWVLTLCTVSALGILGFDHNAYLVLSGLLALYGAVLTGTVLITSRRFVLSLMAESEIERQGQWVELLLRDFEENASDWLWETDRAGHLQHVSMHMAKDIEIPVQELQGRSLVDLLFSLCKQVDHEHRALLDELSHCLAMDVPFRDKVVALRVNGQERWWSLTAKPLFDAKRNMVGWRGVGSDITALRQRDMELTRLASSDSLTGLANRYRFSAHLAGFFAEPQAVRPCTLLLLDIDDFKTINDSLGHVAGDELLCIVAQRLQLELQQVGLLARLGGDEFALIVPQRLDRPAVEVLAQRIQSALNHPLSISDYSVEIHSSIGAGFAPDDADSAEALLRASDMALYAAKAAGRSTLRFFEPEMHTVARRKMDIVSDLRESIHRGDFFLVYQPQIGLMGNSLTGFEALVRWRHPERGVISPLDFIPVAEESGLIVELGTWVLHEACSDAARWPSPLSVSVNLSGVQFERSDLIGAVSSALSLSGLAHHRLELELTESTLMRDSAGALATLNQLRGMGVRVALDDFGTGFSSLSYLRQFPLDKLKIDRSFVRHLSGLENDQSAVAIVTAIVQLAQALGLETTAEGVEETSQHETLQRLGCLLGQGYLYAKPMELVQALEFIESTQSKPQPPPAQIAEALSS